MEVKQAYEILNAATKMTLGDTIVLNEDLSNIQDVGNALYDAGSYDKFARALIDQVGKVVFVTRVYKGWAPNVLRDSWEYGAVLQKIACGLPEATINEDWELTNGTSYDPNVFTQPELIVKFYNKRVTFEIDASITDEQIKSGTQNAQQAVALVAMLHNSIATSMTIKTDDLTMMGVNGMIADTITDGGAKDVKLLTLYNAQFGKSLTADKARLDPDFIKFAIYTMDLYVNRMAGISTLFNIGKQPRFTPKDQLHVVMLSEFEAAAAVYLQSGVYHKDLIELPKHTAIPYWQGSGTDYGFASTSKISVTSGNNNTIDESNIIGVMFDHNAIGVCNVKDRVDTMYNPKANFTNYFYKRFEGIFTDGNENCVVFRIA